MHIQHAKIKEDLKNWRKLIRPYQGHNTKLATIQILNTFLPFIALWILTFYVMKYSYWLGLPLAILWFFSCQDFYYPTRLRSSILFEHSKEKFRRRLGMQYF